MISRFVFRTFSSFKNISDSSINFNNNNFNTVNLQLTNPHHHIFFDQMRVASLLNLSPNILMYKNIPDLNIKKIYFNKINYFDLNNPKLKINSADIHQIQQKYKLLYNHGKFIPYTPYLGYNIINEDRRNWYLWSYTDILKIDNKNEFMEKFYEFNYHKNKFIEKNVLDFLLEYDFKCYKNK